MSPNVCKNFYEVLGIDQNASILDIRKAYKDLALKFHPDKNNDQFWFGTEEKFKLILEAHNVLIDLVERAKEEVPVGLPIQILHSTLKLECSNLVLHQAHQVLVQNLSPLGAHCNPNPLLGVPHNPNPLLLGLNSQLKRQLSVSSSNNLLMRK